MPIRSLRSAAALALACTCLTAARAEEKQVFNPASGRSRLAMPATKVMILGISHLDSAPKAFDPAWLGPVMCRLHAFAPDAILIEAMSGEQLAQIDAYKAVRGEAGKWAGPTLSIARDAQAALGLTGAEALAQADVLASRTTLSAPERRRLAALFLAAGEPFSAAVQWQQLPLGERIVADDVTDAMKVKIERFGTGRGEITSLAVPLAVQLRRSRVYSAGDHLSDAALPDDAVFGAAVKAHPAIIAQFNKATPELQPFGSKALALDAPERVLPVLRALNSPRFGVLDAQSQWLSLQQDASFGPSGRQRVAAWEAQNLRMATTIREVTAPIPGGRALLIVGAAHKAFIEAYLRTMTDIEIVSASAMLDARPAGC